MDKVTFDFEKGQIIFDTDTQKGIETDPELKNKKAAIMAAAGYEMIDMDEFKDELTQMFKKLGYDNLEA